MTFQLINCLQNNTNKFLNSIKELETLEKQLENGSTSLVLRLENIFSKIDALKVTKFVEEVLLNINFNLRFKRIVEEPIFVQNTAVRNTQAV